MLPRILLEGWLLFPLAIHSDFEYDQSKKYINLDHVIVNVAILVDYKALGEEMEEKFSEYPHLKAPEGVINIVLCQWDRLFICFFVTKRSITYSKPNLISADQIILLFLFA